MTVISARLRLGMSRAERSANVRGKTDESEKRQRISTFPLMLLLGVMLFTSLLTFYMTAVSHPYFYVEKVDLRGVKRISQEKMFGFLNPLLTGNIFTRDVKKALALLESEPWISSASIRRVLPNTVEVNITERRAAVTVKLDKLYLVDRQGYILEETRPLPGLLIVMGISSDLKPGDRLVEERFSDLFKLSEIFSHDTYFKDSVEFADLIDPERITVQLKESRLLLRLPPAKEKWEEKFLEYITIRKILAESGTDYRLMDLSFDNQVVVVRGGYQSVEEETTIKEVLVDGKKG